VMRPQVRITWGGPQGRPTPQVSSGICWKIDNRRRGAIGTFETSGSGRCDQDVTHCDPASGSRVACAPSSVRHGRSTDPCAGQAPGTEVPATSRARFHVVRSSGASRQKVRSAPKFPRVRTDQLDDAVLCGLPGSLGRPALPATPVTSFTAARHSHVL
jgi:hypothetical protein